MATSLSSFLRETIDRELAHLNNLTDEAATLNDGRPGSWTKKEELGHLIDSAANNHIRIARAAIDGEFRGPGYAQNKWVEMHGYRDLPWRTIVDFWYQYNALLEQLIARIPETQMENRCVISENAVTLRFVIEDYVFHMQHHIDHVLARETITTYPGAAAAV